MIAELEDPENSGLGLENAQRSTPMTPIVLSCGRDMIYLIILIYIIYVTVKRLKELSITIIYMLCNVMFCFICLSCTPRRHRGCSAGGRRALPARLRGP